jgi:hypothetical protein
MANIALVDANAHVQLSDDNKTKKISDRLFVAQLKHTKQLIYFLLRRQVDLSKSDADFAALSSLSNIKYSVHGQSPSQTDWRNLYVLSHNFTMQLNNAGLVNSFAIWQTRAIYGVLPFSFIVSALIALALAFFNPKILWLTEMNEWDWISFFIAIFLWTFSLGGLGVSAFFGTSLLSQLGSTNTTDAVRERITDINYLRARLALGILFAFVVGLPFGFSSFAQAYKAVTTTIMPLSTYPTVMTRILAPFLFGFSTTLVLGILDRVVDGIRGMLGIAKERS